MRVQFKDLWE